MIHFADQQFKRLLPYITRTTLRIYFVKKKLCMKGDSMPTLEGNNSCNTYNCRYSQKCANGLLFMTFLVDMQCKVCVLLIEYSMCYFFFYIYITPVNNLPLGARKPQRFTNIYNEQYN